MRAMNENGFLVTGDERIASTLARLLQTFSGLTILLGLAVYSFVQVLSYQPVATEIVQTAVRRPAPEWEPFFASNPTPSTPVFEPMVVHFACGQEDARWARTYDPPPSGRSLILRLDQSPEQMRALYAGADPQFPKDTRIVTTPCTQELIDRGEFP